MASPQPTPIRAEGFSLTGPSQLPDPSFNAYRKDLADVALAGHVLASHYAEAIARRAAPGAVLRAGPSETADNIRELGADEEFQMLEDSLGWAWGYAGGDHRVGYIRSDGLTPAS